MSYHRIKPAAFGQERQYHVADGAVHCECPSQNWSMPLSDVREMYFVQNRGSGQVFWRLDLHGAHASHHIDASFAEATRHHNADAAAFVALLSDLCAAIEDIQPGFRLGYGEYGRSRTLLFGVGVLSFLGGLGILAAATLSGVSGEKLAAGAVPITLLTLLGVLMMRSYNPRRDPVPISASRLPKMLRGFAGKNGQGQD